MAGVATVETLDSFGDVAAEDDAVLEYFLTTNALDRIRENKVFLVLGRKGTGKTAIVRYFTEKLSVWPAKPLNLRGYPWNIHATRIDKGASDFEAFVSSWRYLIAVECAALAVSQPGAVLSQYYKNIEKFLTDNYGGIDPHLGDVLRPASIKLDKFSIMPAVMGNQLGGVDFRRKEKFAVELNAVSTALLESVYKLCNDIKCNSISLHFDELDQGLTTLDDARANMLIGLVLACREVRNESSKMAVSISPVVYLRTDIWDDLQFSDKNKITQTLTHSLEWDSDNLKRLVDERIKAKLSSSACWDSITTPEMMRGSQSKWNHILARTFLRPRDVISFLNKILVVHKKRASGPKIDNKDIVDSRADYSTYLKSELDDEIRQHWPQWGEGLQACSAISTITFNKDMFVSEYNKRKTKDNAKDASEALRTLHSFSVIGYEQRSGYGGSSWVFRYDNPEAGWDNTASRFKVHLGLKEYAKLREERQTT